MTERKERTPGTWTVEKWPTKYPDLFTYNIVSDVDPATDQYHVSRYGVASGLDGEVDARLMAAAPELLEALRLFAPDPPEVEYCACRACEKRRANQKIARAAIAKATGEAR